MNLDDIFIIYLPNFFLNRVNASSIIEITNKGNARSKNIYICIPKAEFRTTKERNRDPYYG